jgi:hypothetical protein
MATTTPNYGWPVPTSTDYVKDGATAIEALGDAIDATVFGLPSPALTLISTTSFSAVASQDITGVFSSTYANYLVIMTIENSTTNSNNIRMLTGSVDSSANYDFASERISTVPTTTSIGGSNATAWDLNTGTPAEKNITAVFYKPNLATNTNYSMEFSGSGNTQIGSSGGQLKTATQYTGFRYFPDTGTITGTVRVYGMEN